MSCWKAGVTIKRCAWYEFKVLVLPRKSVSDFLAPCDCHVLALAVIASGCLTQPETPKRRLLFCAIRSYAARVSSPLSACRLSGGRGQVWSDDFPCGLGNLSEILGSAHTENSFTLTLN